MITIKQLRFRSKEVLSMSKRIMIISVLIITVAIICGCIAHGEENGFVKQVRNSFENWLIGGFLKNRGILEDDRNTTVMIEKYLKAAQDEDIDMMMRMFAPAAIAEIGQEKLRLMLASFIEYYDGEYLTITELFGATTDENRYDGKKSKEMRVPIEIETSTMEYRMAVKMVLYNEWNADNVGLWSIYIIDRSKDTDDDQPYRGDLEYRTGIYIDVPRLR